jgi:hypothetical protein
MTALSGLSLARLSSAQRTSVKKAGRAIFNRPIPTGLFSYSVDCVRTLPCVQSQLVSRANVGQRVCNSFEHLAFGNEWRSKLYRHLQIGGIVEGQSQLFR